MRRGYAIQPMDSPAVTVVVPTRGRAAYLEVTLESLRRQRTRTPHELLVVDDGATDATPRGRRAVRRAADPPRRAPQPERRSQHRPARGGRAAGRVRGRRRARSAGLAGRARGGSRAASRRRGVRRADPRPLRGPRTARLRPRGPADHDARPGLARTWRRRWCGARTSRSGARRWSGSGEFDESLDRAHGDEEDWLLRLRAAGGRIVYLADAGLDHRRSAGDSGLGSLARAAYHRGRGARSSDLRRGQAPGARRASCACSPAAAGTPCGAPARRE